MKCRILYFTRTGNSRRIAEKLAIGIDCGTSRIVDDISWKGLLGWFRGGFHSLKGTKTKTMIEDGTELSDFDSIVLVVPLWAGNTAPAGYSFIEDYRKDIKNLFVVISNDGSEAANAFTKLEDRVGKINHKYSITKSVGNEDLVVAKVTEDVLAEGEK